MARAGANGGLIPPPSQATAEVGTGDEWTFDQQTGEPQSPPVNSDVSSQEPKAVPKSNGDTPNGARAPYSPVQQPSSPPVASTSPHFANFARRPLSGHMRTISTSPPLPPPLKSTERSMSAFGTSPFSAPGARSLFLSASYDSDEGLASRSLGTLENHYRDRSNSTAEQVEDEEDWSDGGGEDFLPSSLHELLTEDEMNRRRRRQSIESGMASSAYDPFESWRRRPTLGRAESSDARITATLSRASAFVDSSSVPTTTIPHFNGAAAWTSGSPSSPSIISQSAHQRALLSHPPGSSLPQGLAAGLSRLHFDPPQHTGQTPPPSSYNPSPELGPTNAVGAGSPPPLGSWAIPSSLKPPPGSWRRPHATLAGSPLARGALWGPGTAGDDEFSIPGHRAPAPGRRLPEEEEEEHEHDGVFRMDDV
jgi:hypothetical protein